MEYKCYYEEEERKVKVRIDMILNLKWLKKYDKDCVYLVMIRYSFIVLEEIEYIIEIKFNYGKIKCYLFCMYDFRV